MAKCRAELEQARNTYYELVKKAGSLAQAGNATWAVRTAIQACAHIDGMMQFEKKYEHRTNWDLEAISLVLALAPAVFDAEALATLEELLKSERRIDRDTPANLAKGLVAARARMMAARRLWNLIEQEPDVHEVLVRSKLGGSHAEWRAICEEWERLGVVRRTRVENANRLRMATDMNARVHGKCPSCGLIGTSTKSKFLNGMVCPRCKNHSVFVIGGPVRLRSEQ